MQTIIDDGPGQGALVAKLFTESWRAVPKSTVASHDFESSRVQSKEPQRG